MKILLLIAAGVILASADNKPCRSRDFGEGSTVCVCTADFCDTLDPLGDIPTNQFYHLESSQEGLRFNVSYEAILDKIIGVPDVVVKINRNTKYQKIIGFGGSFTDAATINIAKLSSKLQDHIIEAYYGKTGLEYNIGRINMAGCDFSERLYSYADVEGDVDLEHFSLVREDTEFKIPYVLKSLALNPNIKMFASPWTAPKWMKTNNEYYGQGSLKKEYYQAWANYFVKFLDEYQKLGVTFWAVTAQNEPLDGLLPGFSFNCMGWFPEEQRDFIKINLGPSIETSDHKDTKIIIVDDQRAFIVSWSNTILNDPDAAKYVSGIGVHWYADLISTPSLLATTHRQHPDKFILATEACTGAFPGERPVILGSWHRGELYAADIIEDLNYFVAGWTDWNLVLDMDGGPNWAGNTVDAPIIADSTTDQIYKQPMYYVLGHFSKFIPEDSVRIDSTSDDLKKLFVLTVERPDGKVVAVILNQYDLPMVVALEDEGKVIELLIKAHSIHTLIYTP